MTMTAAPSRAAAARPPASDVLARSAPLTLLLLLLIPLAWTLAAAGPLTDPDVWWHLRTGELLLDEGLVQEDPWSFASTRSWVLHEWLAEVVMYQAYAWGGYAGVVALKCLLIAAFATVLTLTCRQVAATGTSAAVTLVTLVAVTPGLAPRPQLISWVLLAATAPYVFRSVSRRRLPWLLPPTVVIWANLHGLWLTVLVLYGALLLGLAVDEGKRGWRTTARFGGVGALALLAACLNPAGPRLLVVPFHIRHYAEFVREWDPPSIASLPTACAVLLTAVVVVGWAKGSAPVPSSTIAYVAMAAGLGLLYTRTVPVMAICMAPLAAATLQSWSHRQCAPLRWDRGTAVVALAAAAAIAPALVAASADAAAPLPASGSTSATALAATEVLAQVPGRARVLNEYELGGWLLWAARDTTPAIDGRTEIFAVDYVDRYKRGLAMEPGWEQLVEQADADAALLFDDTPLVSGLRFLGWRVAFEQDSLVVLLPPAQR